MRALLIATTDQRTRKYDSYPDPLRGNPESELIAGARNGDVEATAELFRRHYSRSIKVARRILPAQEEFLDGVQSAYLSAFQNFPSISRRRAAFSSVSRASALPRSSPRGLGNVTAGFH